MIEISGVTGSGKKTSLKELLVRVSDKTRPVEDSDPLETPIQTITQAPIVRADPNPKGGVYGARKFRRVLKALGRIELHGVHQGEPLPTPTRRLSKDLRKYRLGYSPAPRQRSSTASGRKASLMMVFDRRRHSRRNREFAAVYARKVSA